MVQFGHSHEHLSTTKQQNNTEHTAVLLNPLIWSLIRLLGTHWDEHHTDCWLPEEEQHKRLLTLTQFRTRTTPSAPLYPAQWPHISHKPTFAPEASQCASKIHTHTHGTRAFDITHCQLQNGPQPPVCNTLSAHVHTHLLYWVFNLPGIPESVQLKSGPLTKP
jgi:hypothetical protein